MKNELNEIKKLIKKSTIRNIKLKEGDFLLIEVENHLNDEQHNYLRKILTDTFGEKIKLILTDGLKINSINRIRIK